MFFICSEVLNTILDHVLFLLWQFLSDSVHENQANHSEWHPFMLALVSTPGVITETVLLMAPNSKLNLHVRPSCVHMRVRFPLVTCSVSLTLQSSSSPSLYMWCWCWIGHHWWAVGDNLLISSTRSVHLLLGMKDGDDLDADREDSRARAAAQIEQCRSQHW